MEENKAQTGIATSETYFWGMKAVAEPNGSRILTEAVVSLRAIKMGLLLQCSAVCW